jgi:hypothetical protein
MKLEMRGKYFVMSLPPKKSEPAGDKVKLFSERILWLDQGYQGGI